MSEVLTGKGPQPPRVYWIRRGLVALVAVAIIGALVWVFTPKNQPTTATPATSPAPAETLVSPTAAPTVSPSATDLPTPDSSTAAPTACDPIGVQLAVEGFKSVKNTGKQVFSVTAENNTSMPCVMEITNDTFRLRVTSGKDLIWTTTHCAKWLPEVKKQTLQAGKNVEFKVNWSMHRSADGCKQAKALLGAGTYIAQANYRETAVDRFVFAVTA
jgi:cytoskeletal protein RodZ